MADLEPIYARNHPHPNPLPEGEGTGNSAGEPKSVPVGGVAAGVLLAGLVVGPLWWHFFDVVFCWFRWAAGSGGTSPGAMYRNVSDCNYPPVVPYLLTATQWLRLHFGWAARTRGEVELIKLPNLLAIVAAGPVLAWGLKPVAGEAPSRRAACRYLLCPALFVDAAVWGQYEAILVLGMVAALLLLMRNRPVWAGACLGAALAVKLQAFVVIPALAVYTARRLGVRAVGKAVAATLGGVVLLALPAVTGGGRVGVWKSYAGAVDYYRSLTIYAANFWEFLLVFREHALHLSAAASNDDRIRVLGRLSVKQVGLAAFLVYTALLMLGLWRRPDRHGLLLAATLTAFGFFMLPTQIHERYILLAIAPLALLTPVGYRRWYWMLACVCAANLLVGIYASNLRYHHTITYAVTRAAEGLYLVSASLNAAAFVGLSVAFFGRALSSIPVSIDAWTETAPL